MQLHIDSFSDLKQGERGPSAKIKCGNSSYYVNEDPTNLVGKDVEAEITEKTSAKGNKYSIARIIKVLEEKSAGAQASNGKVAWLEYQIVAKAAHALALDLEPDYEAGNIDRSAARAAIVNTAMIAFANGKISMPEVEETPFD